MPLVEYYVEIDQDLWYSMLLDDVTDWPNPVSPPVVAEEPTLTSLLPTTAPSGTAIDIVLTGTLFYPDVSRVVANGVVEQQSTVDSATQITVRLNAGTPPGTHEITVANGHFVSNSLDFTVTDPAEE